MEALQSLPSWAVVLLALLAAAVLIALNLGWLLSAKAMLDARRRNPGSTTSAPSDAAKREPPRTVRDADDL
jgi:hypothetical protein